MRFAERDILLLMLAVAAGSADGWSYFGLGDAFVANMTGNTVLLGIAVFLHGDLLHPCISLVCYAAGVALPFVGPAGKLLMRCLSEAEIDPRQVFITNAVKHFKWKPKGKIRLHKKPTLTEIRACKPWLEAELDAVKPKLIVCLGATAAQSLLGPKFRVSQSRGHAQETDGLPPVIATVYPASILRAQSDDDRQRQTAEFIADLRRAKKYLRSM